MKSKHVVIVITMVLILLVVLVACSQAEQQQEPQDLNAQQTTPVTDVPTDVPTVEPAQTVEPVEADAQGEAGGAGEAGGTGEVATPVKSGATEKEVLSNEELLELFQNVYDYYKGDIDSTEEEKIEAELKMIENSAKIAYRKDLPADYKERYIDWRPIEGDPDEGLVDTGTNTDAGSGSTTDTGSASGTGTSTGTESTSGTGSTGSGEGTGTGGTYQDYVDEFTRKAIEAGILHVVDPSEESQTEDLTGSYTRPCLENKSCTKQQVCVNYPYGNETI